MKIAHIASAYDIINSQSVARPKLIYLLAKEQQRQGHEVTVLSAPGSYIKGCTCVSFVKPVKLPRSRFSFWLKRREVEFKHHYRSLKWLGDSHEIIHNHIMEEGLLLSSIARSPSIITHHGGSYNSLLQKIIGKLYLIPSKAPIVAISKHTFLAHTKIFGNSVMGYVYNCIDPADVNFVPKPLKDHEIELCFLGRCIPDKGVHLAIQAVDKVHNMGIDVHLKLFLLSNAGYFDYMYRILDLVRQRPYIDAKVDRLSLDPLPILANSDALLFPALWNEPFGYVLIESLACGVPIVAFPRGAVSEIVKDNVNGLLCNDVDGMVDAILNIRKIDRQNCRRTVEDNFSALVTQQRYLDLYKKVLNHTTARKILHCAV